MRTQVCGCLFARQTNRFTAGGSDSRRVRSFCFDSIARDVPPPPQSSARLFAQKAEAGSASPPQFIVTAATIELPTRKPEPWGQTGASHTFLPFVFPTVCLVWGKIALAHHKIRKITGTANTGGELRSPRQSGGGAVK